MTIRDWAPTWFDLSDDVWDLLMDSEVGKRVALLLLKAEELNLLLEEDEFKDQLVKVIRQQTDVWYCG